MTDDHGTPEAAFASAQSAMAAGDLAAVFVCFDRGDLTKIAGNSVRALSAADPDVAELCDRFGFGTLGELRELTERMAASAALVTDDRASYDPVAHRQLVKDYEAAIKNGLRDVADLPGFTAAMEDRMRRVLGGGSISSSLFGGETLAGVVVDGKKAWATRTERGREVEDVGFVLTRDGWKIKLFARRPAR
jgi:hypothetical protein